MDLYEQIREVCAQHHTTLTTVLKATNHATSSTGAWKAGKSPRLDIIMDIAEYLNISLDELCYGRTAAAQKLGAITPDQKEWLDIVSRIPEGRQEMCKAFLRTHMTIPEKYVGKITG